MNESNFNKIVEIWTLLVSLCFIELDDNIGCMHLKSIFEMCTSTSQKQMNQNIINDKDINEDESYPNKDLFEDKDESALYKQSKYFQYFEIIYYISSIKSETNKSLLYNPSFNLLLMIY